ncbi:hypothetical protein EON81_04695 [bacterium]|nr:MAG: hypothetical protein EON81_04695 [bacterium]
MKRRRLMGGLIVAAGVTTLLVSTAYGRISGQRLWLTAQEVNIQEGEPANIVIFNPTAEEVRLKPVPTCGCIGADLGNLRLPPRSGTVFTIKVADASLIKPGTDQLVVVEATSHTRSWSEVVHVTPLVRTSL